MRWILRKLVPGLALAAALSACLLLPSPASAAGESARWVAMASGTASDLNGLWGSADNDVFAVGAAGTVMHYDGRDWSLAYTENTISLRAVWGSSATDVFAVGSGGAIRHYDGRAWGRMAADNTTDLRAVWGRSATDVFAAGSGGAIRHYDGKLWASMTSSVTATLYGLWGAFDTAVFAAGSGGALVRYDGRAWTALASGTSADLYGVWGSAATDIFAVGKAGTVIHYDGKAWSPMVSGTAADLNAVWGSSGTDVYAAGSAGTIIHYDGRAWSPMTRNVAVDLRGLWGASSAEILAAGAAGTIVRCAPPVVSAVTPGQGSQAGTYEITLTGRNFSGATEVGFGAGIAVNSFTVNGPGQITASIAVTAGAAAGPRDITVSGPGGAATLPGGFTVRQALPVISSVTPAQANQETSLNITLTGANFSGATGVNFGPGITVNSFGVAGASQITASITVNAGAATGVREVSVTTPGGTTTLPAGFTVRQALPVITTVSPGQASLGATLDVTLSGKNFSGTSEVRFGAGVAVNRFTVISATALTANISILASTAPGAREVSVTTPGGTASLPDGFMLKKGLPVIASVSPAEGNLGDTLDVLINGSNLDAASTVDFGRGIAVSGVSSRSATQVAARVTISANAGAGPRDVAVTTDGGAGSLAGGFVVKEGPLGALFIALVWVGIALALTALWYVLRLLRRRKNASLRD